ncbi:YeiH family protein [Filimonas effusa]|uniref:Putative sulfate exporter family transporter n=1 Tax=Filimonas effusa TaxID=2508721 RepID=A0A4Q1DBC3_9BACT|nr:putative sulfate exporter family transporter [Filimonas effusa]RXK85873.1 putative sulfate exporter family transporter [Filimonas effusa]
MKFSNRFATVRHLALADRSMTTKELLFLLAAASCFTPLVSAPAALLLGIGTAQFIGHPYLHLNHSITRLLLQVSVVGLGFGMNIYTAAAAGREGFGITAISIIATLTGGVVLGKLLGVEKKTAYLITSGTAICGGSAIAAVSPVIKAEEKQMTVALGTVFILNSAALFIFPVVGRWIGLNETQFGLWSAIAIHDTSSVVGAAAKYGPEALAVATTVKLARALWIVPVGVISALVFRQKKGSVKLPWFILFFIAAMLLNTYVPVIQAYGHYLVKLSHSGLTLTLFLIGSGLSAGTLRQVGFKPFIQGIVLWALISAGTLYYLCHH